jgi:hypothetical protein
MTDTLGKLKQILDEETQAVEELAQYWIDKDPSAEWIPADRWMRRWVRTYDMDLMKHAIDVTFLNMPPESDCVRKARYASAVARNIRDFIKHAERVDDRAAKAVIDL